MGLVRAAIGSAKGVLADQWKEYIYCASMPADVLVTRGRKRVSGRSGNRHGSDNIITSGSVIAVADGQCMLIVEQGRVVEVCAEPGEFRYDASSEPSVFNGDLEDSMETVFEQIGKRFAFGGQPANDQRVYYVNTKELTGNKYGTANPVPFRVIDANVGLDMDITIKCFGEYSYRIADPILFYTNVCGNIEADFTREELDAQLKSELLTALQPAFAKISDQGIRYSSLPGHTTEIADALNEVLSSRWAQLRGIRIVSFGVSSVKASEEDERTIKELQRNAAFKNPQMAAAQLVGAQAASMQAAASNKNAGPTMAFAGMNMASNAGGLNAQELYAMGQQQAVQQTGRSTPVPMQPAGNGSGNVPEDGSGNAFGWICSCGASNTGNFCSNCGKPAPRAEWSCGCGTRNAGNFCSNCGKPRP